MLYNRKERVFAGGRNMRKIKRIIICVIMAFVMICVGNNAFSKARDIKAEETQNNELKGTYGDNCHCCSCCCMAYDQIYGQTPYRYTTVYYITSIIRVMQIIWIYRICRCDEG